MDESKIDKTEISEHIHTQNPEIIKKIISRKTENTGYSIGDIKIDSEPMESKDGKTRNVSTIEIKVERK